MRTLRIVVLVLLLVVATGCATIDRALDDVFPATYEPPLRPAQQPGPYEGAIGFALQAVGANFH